MAGTITLTYSATAITIAAPDYPGIDHEDIDQVRSRAMGGRVISLTRSAGSVRNPELRWQTMSATDYSSLSSFIFDTVAGSTRAFTYQDVTGASCTVRYLGGLEDAQLANYDLYEVTLNLAEVA